MVSPRKLSGALAIVAGLLLLAPPAAYAVWAYGLTTICLTNMDVQRLSLFAAAGVACLALGLWALLGARRTKRA